MPQSPRKRPAPGAPSRSARRPAAPRLDWGPGTLLYPLPVVLVTSGDAQSGFNVCTVAWTGTVCSDPAMCYISLRPSRHSYGIIKRIGEFVVNLTTERLARATDWCGVRSGRDYDKFRECALTPRPAARVACPVIAESPLALECKVQQILPLGSHDMFLAEIVGVSADGRFLDPKTDKFDLAAARPLVFLHGHYYALGRDLGKFGFSVEKKRKR